MEIRRIQQELGITTVYVSHDQEECFSISDQVAIMNRGNIEQLDAPSTIFRYPASEYVARFIGFQNFLSFSGRDDTGSEIELTLGEHAFKAAKHQGTARAGTLKGAFRPDDLLLEADDSRSVETANTLPGVIRVSTYLGRSYQYVVDTPHGEFTVNEEMETPYLSGQSVRVVFPKDRMILVE